MRPITTLTLAGTGFPILLAGIAKICDLPVLGLVAVGLAIVLPSIGHIVYRRTIRTRGFYTRLGGAAFGGLMLLMMANSKDLGDAITFAIAAIIAGVIAFCVGSVLDTVDAQRSGNAHTS